MDDRLPQYSFEVKQYLVKANSHHIYHVIDQ